MSLKKLSNEIDFEPDKEESEFLKKETKKFLEILNHHVRKNKIDADVFVGGSFAKGTVAKSKDYDVDIFVRFDLKYSDLSKLLEKIMNGVSKEIGIEFLRVHGSRDYFNIEKTKKLTFEIIPVLRIKKVKEAQNVTDLSYFHVKYIKKSSEGKQKEILLAKKFFKAQKFYGAESYIQGFSGYSLECLIVNFGSFEKMLKALVKIKDKLILDPAKHYKKKNDVFFELNESKLQGPIILVDPTGKERNVLAALSDEMFKKFQAVAQKFLKNPSRDFFELIETKENSFRKLAVKKNAEFVKIILESDRQEGDIAGTKMKKFVKFLKRAIGQYFEILESDFEYCGSGKISEVYFVVKSKKKIARKGPPIGMMKAVKDFKKKNKKAYEKNGSLWVDVNVESSVKKYLKDLWNSERKRSAAMSIKNLEIIS